jgi:hypothetical protein
MSNLAGIAKPSRAVRSLLLVSRSSSAPAPLPVMLAELTAIEALAGVLLTAVKANTTSDGRVDTRDVAVAVVEALAPRKLGTLEALINNGVMVTALARLLTECFDEAIKEGRDINMSTAAAHVFKHMRSAQ